MNGRDRKKMNQPNVSETRISDLQLASYLLASGHPLIRTEGTRPRCIFIFANVPEDVVFQYYSGKDAISARQLFSAYRDLRGLVVQCL